MSLLFFGKGNAKLGVEIYTFSLPAGWTCPGASACLARSDRETGKLTDGMGSAFRCFAASQEAMYPAVRNARWANIELLKGLSREAMAALILASLPAKAELIRVHVSGDFFTEAYFLAWCDVARSRSEVLFYAYTKSLHYWAKNAASVPANLKLTASEGGKFDSLIGEQNLKYARVVFSQEEAGELEIDHDDSHAYGSEYSFALLLHGTQAKGSVAAKALSALRAQGLGGYSTERK